jgi:hypothetical protein
VRLLASADYFSARALRLPSPQTSSCPLRSALFGACCALHDTLVALLHAFFPHFCYPELDQLTNLFIPVLSRSIMMSSTLPQLQTCCGDPRLTCLDNRLVMCYAPRGTGARCHGLEAWTGVVEAHAVNWESIRTFAQGGQSPKGYPADSPPLDCQVVKG